MHVEKDVNSSHITVDNARRTESCKCVGGLWRCSYGHAGEHSEVCFYAVDMISNSAIGDILRRVEVLGCDRDVQPQSKTGLLGRKRVRITTLFMNSFTLRYKFLAVTECAIARFHCWVKIQRDVHNHEGLLSISFAHDIK